MHACRAPSPQRLSLIYVTLSCFAPHSAVPYKAQEMVDRPSPLGSEAVTEILRSVQLGVTHGYLDPSPHNEAGAAYWTSASGETLICECRVEGNPTTRSQFRVTVSSPNPVLSESVKGLIAGQIRSAPTSA